MGGLVGSAGYLFGALCRLYLPSPDRLCVWLRRFAIPFGYAGKCPEQEGGLAQETGEIGQNLHRV